MHFWENIKLSMSFSRDLYKYIFGKYNCMERRAHLLVAVVRIEGWVAGSD